MRRNTTKDLGKFEEEKTVGPACYNIKRLIGKDNIAQSHIKSGPKFSFNRTQTNRTMDIIQCQSPDVSKTYQGAGEVSLTSLSSPKGANEIMLFHKTARHNIPGVGQYDAHSVQLNLRSKSPRATIGKQSRFDRKDSLNGYLSNLPVTYIKDPAKVQPSKPKMGTIGRARRFLNVKKNSVENYPGVGRYNISNFVNLSKAAGTMFDSGSEQIIQTVGNSPVSHDRGLVKLYQTFTHENSQSPAHLSTSKSPKRRILGGPVLPNSNYIMNSSREQRAKLFVPEIVDASHAGKGVPGPGRYNTEKYVPILHGQKIRYSIPRVSHYFPNLDFVFIQAKKYVPKNV